MSYKFCESFVTGNFGVLSQAQSTHKLLSAGTITGKWSVVKGKHSLQDVNIQN